VVWGGREDRGGFRMGNTCIPVMASFCTPRPDLPVTPGIS